MSSDDKHPQLGAGILVHRKIRRRREGEEGEGDALRGTGDFALEVPPARPPSPRADLWSGGLDPFGDDPFALDPFAPLPPEEPEEEEEPLELSAPLELPAPLELEPALDPGLDVTLDPTTAWTRDRATVEFRPPPGMLEAADDFFDDASVGPARATPAPAPSRRFSARALDDDLLDPFAESLLGQAPPPSPSASPSPSPSPSPASLLDEDAFDWSGGSWELSSPGVGRVQEAQGEEGADELEALLAARLDDSSADDLSILELSSAHRVEPGPPRPPMSRSISHRSDDWQREALEELGTRLHALESAGLGGAGAATPRGVLPPRWGTLDAQDGVITAGLEVVYEVDAWLLAAVRAGAQGLVLASGAWPFFQTEEGVERGPGPALTLERWEALLRPLCGSRGWELVRDGSGVLEHRVPDGASFRVALTWGGGAAVAVFQRQLRGVLGVVDLGLPRAAEGLLGLRGGLVLLTGPLGSGRRAALAALLRGWEARQGGRALVLDPRPCFELSALGVTAQERTPGLHGATLEAMLPTLTRERPARVVVVDGAGAALARALLEVVWGGGLAVVVARAATVEAALSRLAAGDLALHRELIEALSGLLCLRRVPLSEGGAALAASVAVVDAPLGEALLSGRADVESWLRANPAAHRQSLGVTLEGWIARGWCEPEAAAAALAGQPAWQAALREPGGVRA